MARAWREAVSAIVLAVAPALGAGARATAPGGAQAPTLALSVTHTARAVGPGEVVRLRIEASEPLASLDGTAFGRPVAFWQESPSVWTGLVGLAHDVPAGPRLVRLTATTSGGRRDTATHRLTVGTRSFPTRRITVDPKYLEPPADTLDRIRAEQERLQQVFQSPAAAVQWREPFAMPVGTAITSRYGNLRIVNGTARRYHLGLDLGGDVGTPVAAPNRGRVVVADDLYFTGNTVVLDHGLGLFSTLAHLSRIDVTVGDLAERGRLVGAIGATGRVTGPHLHWTLRLGGVMVDPESIVALDAQ